MGALKVRLQKAGVPATSIRVLTIDAFCIRLINRFPERSAHDPKILELSTPKADYRAIRAAAFMLIHAGHLDGIFAALCERLVVDEYQDCDLQQHAVVDGMAATLHTCVLGDPTQAIFNFAGPVVHWVGDGPSTLSFSRPIGNALALAKCRKRTAWKVASGSAPGIRERYANRFKSRTKGSDVGTGERR